MMENLLNYPFDAHLILRKKRAIKRSLLQNSDFTEKKIAILGGSTTAEIKEIFELFLLNENIKPIFYESSYNRYYEDIVFDNPQLRDFAPDIIYIHTTSVNITSFPRVQDTSAEIDRLFQEELDRFRQLWQQIEKMYQSVVIQNNFELPYARTLGNLDVTDLHGSTNFIQRLNQAFADHARQSTNFHLHDINYLSSWFGLEKWYDKSLWYTSKYALNYQAIPLLAYSLTSIVKSIHGKSKKCLVLDLDNTLWGGVIGDDGLDGIQLGKEPPSAEAFSDFQQYIKKLKDRGIILAVCSKNDPQTARRGFEHPDSILSLDDFSAFQANWESKDQNILSIAQSLNIGLDSLVFLDDNPAERNIVSSQIPGIAVPDITEDVSRYIAVLDKGNYFNTTSLSQDDLQRHRYYAENVRRFETQARFRNYDDYLRSLEMEIEIKPFASLYLERITQLTNKTNQFNLTTRRYTLAEIEAIARDPYYITLYARLRDKFGDNGVISVLIAAVKGRELHIDLWLMSCRVLKRNVELALMDSLLQYAQDKGIDSIFGYYYPTPKNDMVRSLYGEMGFKQISSNEKGAAVWACVISQNYQKKNQLIKVLA